MSKYIVTCCFELVSELGTTPDAIESIIGKSLVNTYRLAADERFYVVAVDDITPEGERFDFAKWDNEDAFEGMRIKLRKNLG